IAQLNAGLALWAIWRLAREILPPVPALVSVVLLEGSRSFSYGSEVVNHDTVSLPFWALAAWFVWRAVRLGRWGDWLCAGLRFGLVLYAKSWFALLLLTSALFVVIEPTARRRLKSAGPWLAALLLLLVVSPQIWALATQPAQPFAFAQSRAKPMRTALDVVWYPADFLVNQLLHLAPLIAMGLLVFVRRPRSDDAATCRRAGTCSRLRSRRPRSPSSPPRPPAMASTGDGVARSGISPVSPWSCCSGRWCLARACCGSSGCSRPSSRWPPRASCYARP